MTKKLIVILVCSLVFGCANSKLLADLTENVGGLFGREGRQVAGSMSKVIKTVDEENRPQQSNDKNMEREAREKHERWRQDNKQGQAEERDMVDSEKQSLDDMTLDDHKSEIKDQSTLANLSQKDGLNVPDRLPKDILDHYPITLLVLFHRMFILNSGDLLYDTLLIGSGVCSVEMNIIQLKNL